MLTAPKWALHLFEQKQLARRKCKGKLSLSLPLFTMVTVSQKFMPGQESAAPKPQETMHVIMILKLECKDQFRLERSLGLHSVFTFQEEGYIRYTAAYSSVEGLGGARCSLTGATSDSSEFARCSLVTSSRH